MEKFDAALRAYEMSDWRTARLLALEVLAQEPRHAGALYIAGALELDAGDAASALLKLKAAADVSPDHPGIRRSLGQAFAALDEWPQAVSAYHDALRLGPPDPGLLAELGLALHEAEDFDGAVRAFELSLRLKPDDAAVYNNLAVTLNRKHDYEAAAAAYKRGLSLEPGNLGLLSNLAMLYEQMNEVELAEETAAIGLGLEPRNGILNLVAARCERRRGAPEDAIRRIESTLALDSTSLQARRGLHFELGRDYDGIGEIDKAFRHFQSGNRIADELWPDMVAGGARYLEELDEMLAACDEKLLRGLEKTPSPPSPNGLVFLVGFPRSGTTLMDTILGSHPEVAVMEEEPPLHKVHEAVFNAYGPDPRALSALPEAKLDELRALYWSEARKYLGDSLRPGQLVVDKNPFYSTRALLIHRLFPDAKFVFALRHPCAVVLSCFMQPFGRNPALANFTSLTGGAQTYRRVMQLWLRFRSNLPLDCHELRYEALVTDKDTHVRSTLEFLGLGWDDALSDHVAHAQKRGRIYTPSYHQVSRPLYTDSLNRWRNYESYMEEAVALLEPYIREFGYATT